MKKLFLLALSAIFICSCSSSGTDENPNPDSSVIGIELSSYNLTFGSTGGEETVSVYLYSHNGSSGDANAQWQLTGGESWCVPSKTSGGDYSRITFTIAENLSPDERDAAFTFTCGSVTNKLVVVQRKLPTIHVTQKGTLAATITQMGLRAEDLSSVKITGVLNNADLITIKTKMVKLKNLYLQETDITILPNEVFKECRLLENIALPHTLTTIGESAFSYCSSLTTVTFEQGSQLQTIGSFAFFACRKLTSIQIPASVETIERQAFTSCSSLTTVTFEQGAKLKIIELAVFMSCGKLTSIQIPASVETIERGAFDGCSSLTTVTFEQGSQLKIIEGNINDGAFLDCTSLTSIEIPASVETIERGAFDGCSSLTTVTFEQGSQLKIIGDPVHCGGGKSYGAFSDCIALTSIQIPASVETIGADSFRNCMSLASVTFEHGSKLKTIKGDYNPDNDTPDYKGAFSDCIALTSIQIPASVETIEAAAFSHCSSLTTVTFEKGSQLKEIIGYYLSTTDGGAFSYCQALTTVDASECALVTRINECAFNPCKNLRLFKIGTNRPPYCCTNTFAINPSSTLKVPTGCVDAYKKASGWSDFTSITELDE